MIILFWMEKQLKKDKLFTNRKELVMTLISNKELQDNLNEVEEKICAACKRSGRKREEVTLIAVSKTKPSEMIQVLYDTGIRDFGENKVQEILTKAPVLPDDIHWHMIGHLQRNKVKQVVTETCMIHSVDSLRLAEEIEHEAAKHNLVIPILLEVNIAGEESKFGMTKEEALDLVVLLSRFRHIAVKGLMTIAPNVEKSEENRPIFRNLKQLSVDIINKNIDNISMDVLSMGMTNDYEVAIEEGATIVRVGTGIFGTRYYG